MSDVSQTQGVLALEVQGIEAGYGPMTVLRGLSLQVGRSEIVGVLGHLERFFPASPGRGGEARP